jgi:hypothetical protein
LIYPTGKDMEYFLSIHERIGNETLMANSKYKCIEDQ